MGFYERILLFSFYERISLLLVSFWAFIFNWVLIMGPKAHSEITDPRCRRPYSGHRTGNLTRFPDFDVPEQFAIDRKTNCGRKQWRREIIAVLSVDLQ